MSSYTSKVPLLVDPNYTVLWGSGENLKLEPPPPRPDADLRSKEIGDWHIGTMFKI